MEARIWQSIADALLKCIPEILPAIVESFTGVRSTGIKRRVSRRNPSYRTPGVDQELKELRVIAGLSAVEPTPPTEDAGSGEAKL
jgi:hypothetical protein